ncbi:MAG: hypothetical protein JXA33_12440 [Anaerolineae bacterium]|nr:hypothetical protein [Anaerolineae bacterium]
MLTRTFLLLLGYIAVMYLPIQTGEGYDRIDTSPLLDMWYRWDAGYYTAIATYGYSWAVFHKVTADMAFMPLYPLAIRGLNTMEHCSTRACATLNGILISNLALLISIYILFDFIQIQEGDTIAYQTVALLLLSPFSVFFSGVYTESLFLCLSLLTFLALHKDRFILAICTASLACLTRTVGLALYFPLMIWVWQKYWRVQGNLDTILLSIRRFLTPLAAHIPVFIFIGYIAFMGWHVGDWTGYFKANALFWKRDGPGHLIYWLVMREGGSVDDMVFAVLYIILVIFTWRKDLTLGGFALAAIALPLLSGNLASMRRYGSVVFPFYWTLAQQANRANKLSLIYLVSIVLLIIYTLQFVTWHWVA